MLKASLRVGKSLSYLRRWSDGDGKLQTNDNVRLIRFLREIETSLEVGCLLSQRFLFLLPALYSGILEATHRVTMSSGPVSTAEAKCRDLFVTMNKAYLGANADPDNQAKKSSVITATKALIDAAVVRWQTYKANLVLQTIDNPYNIERSCWVIRNQNPRERGTQYAAHWNDAYDLVRYFGEPLQLPCRQCSYMLCLQKVDQDFVKWAREMRKENLEKARKAASLSQLFHLMHQWEQHEVTPRSLAVNYPRQDRSDGSDESGRCYRQDNYAAGSSERGESGATRSSLLPPQQKATPEDGQDETTYSRSRRTNSGVNQISQDLQDEDEEEFAQEEDEEDPAEYNRAIIITPFGEEAEESDAHESDSSDLSNTENPFQPLSDDTEDGNDEYERGTYSMYHITEDWQPGTGKERDQPDKIQIGEALTPRFHQSVRDRCARAIKECSDSTYALTMRDDWESERLQVLEDYVALTRQILQNNEPPPETQPHGSGVANNPHKHFHALFKGTIKVLAVIHQQWLTNTTAPARAALSSYQGAFCRLFEVCADRSHDALLMDSFVAHCIGDANGHQYMSESISSPAEEQDYEQKGEFANRAEVHSPTRECEGDMDIHSLALEGDGNNIPPRASTGEESKEQAVQCGNALDGDGSPLENTVTHVNVVDTAPRMSINSAEVMVTLLQNASDGAANTSVEGIVPLLMDSGSSQSVCSSSFINELHRLARLYPNRIRFERRGKKKGLCLRGASNADLGYVFDCLIFCRFAQQIEEADGETKCFFHDQSIGLTFRVCTNLGPTNRLIVGTAAMQQMRVTMDMHAHLITFELGNQHSIVPMSSGGCIFDSFMINSSKESQETQMPMPLGELHTEIPHKNLRSKVREAGASALKNTGPREKSHPPSPMDRDWNGIIEFSCHDPTERERSKFEGGRSPSEPSPYLLSTSEPGPDTDQKTSADGQSNLVGIIQKGGEGNRVYSLGSPAPAPTKTSSGWAGKDELILDASGSRKLLREESRQSQNVTRNLQYKLLDCTTPVSCRLHMEAITTALDAAAGPHTEEHQNAVDATRLPVVLCPTASTKMQDMVHEMDTYVNCQNNPREYCWYWFFTRNNAAAVYWLYNKGLDARWQELRPALTAEALSKTGRLPGAPFVHAMLYLYGEGLIDVTTPTVLILKIDCNAVDVHLCPVTSVEKTRSTRTNRAGRSTAQCYQEVETHTGRTIIDRLMELQAEYPTMEVGFGDDEELTKSDFNWSLLPDEPAEGAEVGGFTERPAVDYSPLDPDLLDWLDSQTYYGLEGNGSYDSDPGAHVSASNQSMIIEQEQPGSHYMTAELHAQVPDMATTEAMQLDEDQSQSSFHEPIVFKTSHPPKAQGIQPATTAKKRTAASTKGVAVRDERIIDMMNELIPIIKNKLIPALMENASLDVRILVLSLREHGRDRQREIRHYRHGGLMKPKNDDPQGIEAKHLRQMLDARLDSHSFQDPFLQSHGKSPWKPHWDSADLKRECLQVKPCELAHPNGQVKRNYPEQLCRDARRKALEKVRDEYIKDNLRSKTWRKCKTPLILSTASAPLIHASHNTNTR
jgi:hypothetical protein